MAIINNYETFKLIILRFLIQTVNSLDAFSRLILKVRICCTFDQNQNSSWKTIDEMMGFLGCAEKKTSPTLTHFCTLCFWVIFAQSEKVSQKHKVQKWLKCTKWKSESTLRTSHFCTLCIWLTISLCAKMTQKHNVQKWVRVGWAGFYSSYKSGEYNFYIRANC